MIVFLLFGRNKSWLGRFWGIGIFRGIFGFLRGTAPAKLRALKCISLGTRRGRQPGGPKEKRERGCQDRVGKWEPTEYKTTGAINDGVARAAIWNFLKIYPPTSISQPPPPPLLPPGGVSYGLLGRWVFLGRSENREFKITEIYMPISKIFKVPGT